eukprot:g6700.t1
MAPKKAKAKKKSTGDDRGDEKADTKAEGSLPAEPPLAMPSDEEWVTLDLKNLLLEHHGRVDDLILCKGSFTEANELKDEMQTLKGYGIKGAPRGVEPPVTVPLFYDFKPVAYDEPLLLLRGKMATSVDGGSVTSEIEESIEEIEDSGQRSDYSLEFDDEPDSPVLGHRGNGQGGNSHARGSVDGGVGAGLANQRLQRQEQQDAGRRAGGLVYGMAGDDGVSGLYSHRPEASQAKNGLEQERKRNPPPSPKGAPIATAGRTAAAGGNSPRDEDNGKHGESNLPVQVLALKSRLDGLLHHIDNRSTATEAITAVTKEHAALRDCLGDVERELVKARRKVTDDATARLRAAREKRARAEGRRVRHFQQLGEARRMATVAKAEAEAIRVRLADRETELRHTRDMLETARSAASTAGDRADRCQATASAAEDRANGLLEELRRAQDRADEESRRAAAAVRDAQDQVKLCERQREVEVNAATRGAEARERAAEEQLNRLPEHQRQLLQAELDRVARWEERLAAEAASLQRREEAHKVDMEAWRADAARIEAESRTRAEEDVSRQRASLKETRSALDVERGGLLRRVARAEAAGQAAAVEATAARAEADEVRRRAEAERAAVEIRAATLAPELRALEEGRAALEGLQREAREEARRAKEKACHALEREAEVVEREAAVEVKWKEITASRRALKQMEKSVADEAEGLFEQRKAVALARVRLHEQQMEMALQMSEIRKAIALIKRVDTIEDAPARRMALELGEVACDRGEMAARRTGNIGASAGPDGYERGGSGGGGGGGRSDSGIISCNRRGIWSLAAGVGEAKQSWRTMPGQGSAAWDLATAGTGADNAPKSPIPEVEDARSFEDTRVDTAVMQRGRGAYADDAGARNALAEVRSVLASTGDGWRRPSGVGGDADEGGGGWGGVCWGGSVQSWESKLKASAVATGALQSFS